ncbi:MAG TPA: AMIN domain-containing protein [Candidatus Sulfotelmatobacter sp.]|jgi:hypothetical protein
MLAGVSLLAASLAMAQSSVRAVKVLGAKDVVEIEVDASDRIVPETRVLTGPDRLVVDFPNAVPGKQLRSQSVDRGEVKDLRVGLFQAKPPVTRVVLDLKTAQSYQVFPNGRTVIIKVMGGAVLDASAGAGNFPADGASADGISADGARRPSLVTANYTTRAEPVSVLNSVEPVVDITYRDGMLGIRANKVTLAQVLYAVQQRTGAEVSIAAGAEQEKVVAEIEPAPAPEVLARLLNGSKFNFLILSAVDDPAKLDRVILSARPDGGYVPPPAPVLAQNQQQNQNENREDEQAPMSQPGARPPASEQVGTPPSPEAKATEETTPD